MLNFSSIKLSHLRILKLHLTIILSIESYKIANLFITNKRYAEFERKPKYMSFKINKILIRIIILIFN